MDNLVYTVLAILFSGLLATIIAHCMQRNYNVISVKRDVLRRFVAYRYVLTNPMRQSGHFEEFFVALNEICVVFAGEQEVISALKKMRNEIDKNDQLYGNLINLLKAMAKAAKIPLKDLDSDFLLTPFTPRSLQE